MESRADQVARIRRDGLPVDSLEQELIRAESRALGITPTPKGACLCHRVLEYLGSNTATALQVSQVLGAGLNQTHRAIVKLQKANRIKVVERIESPKGLGVLVNVWGRPTNGDAQ